MKILIVDDEPVARECTAQAVRQLGFQCQVAESGERAWRMFQDTHIDIIVSDWFMDDLDGLELCRKVRGACKDTYTYFILLTVSDQERMTDAIAAGVDDFLTKPLDSAELAFRFIVAERVVKLRQEVRIADQRIALLNRQSHRRGSLEGMVGKSEIMERVYERVRLASHCDVPVHAFGESGTGKELVAQAVHNLSARSSQPFITVNCGAIPETIVESELFGHVRGAFTGAVRDKIGYFQMAHRGTLFLDEIGDVSPLIQLKLLRAVEEGQIRRVGDDSMTEVDVRIITATNKDLRELVTRGEFREDLIYRIRVFQIDVPPLRKRREDIPMLVEHFLTHVRSGRSDVTGLTSSALRALMNYNWPGNVREVRNAVEHALVTASAADIRLQDLPPEVRREPATANGSQNSRVAMAGETIAALQASGGNRSRAARDLGISRAALWKRIRSLQIEDQIPPAPSGRPLD